MGGTKKKGLLFQQQFPAARHPLQSIPGRGRGRGRDGKRNEAQEKKRLMSDLFVNVNKREREKERNVCIRTIVYTYVLYGMVGGFIYGARQNYFRLLGDLVRRLLPSVTRGGRE